MIEKIGVLVHLLRIAATKFVPASRIVTKPFAKFGARGDVLHPLIDGGTFFGDPTWPKSVD